MPYSTYATRFKILEGTINLRYDMIYNMILIHYVKRLFRLDQTELQDLELESGALPWNKGISSSSSSSSGRRRRHDFDDCDDRICFGGNY